MELIDEKVKRGSKMLIEAKFMIENILKITSRKMDPKKIKFYLGLPMFNIGCEEASPFVNKKEVFFSFKNMQTCRNMISVFEFSLQSEAKKCIDCVKKNYIELLQRENTDFKCSF